MSKITVIKGDLFQAPSGSIIVHACNTVGVWGSGIAKSFAIRYPWARDLYSQICKEDGNSLLGTCLLIDAGEIEIGCLFTSSNFGAHKDAPSRILENTRLAMADLIAQNKSDKPIHMCKINAGLFAVPWEDTEKVLNEFDQEITVYEL